MNIQYILLELHNVKNKLIDHIDYLSTSALPVGLDNVRINVGSILEDVNQLVLYINSVDKTSQEQFYTQTFRSLDEFVEDDSEIVFPCKYGISFDDLKQDCYQKLFDLQDAMSAAIEIELGTNNGDGTFSGMLLLTIDDIYQMIEVKNALSVLEVA